MEIDKTREKKQMINERGTSEMKPKTISAEERFQRRKWCVTWPPRTFRYSDVSFTNISGREIAANAEIIDTTTAKRHHIGRFLAALVVDESPGMTEGDNK